MVSPYLPTPQMQRKHGVALTPTARHEHFLPAVVTSANITTAIPNTSSAAFGNVRNLLQGIWKPTSTEIWVELDWVLLAEEVEAWAVVLAARRIGRDTKPSTTREYCANGSARKERCGRRFSRVDNMKDHMRRIHRKGQVDELAQSGGRKEKGSEVGRDDAGIHASTVAPAVYASD